MYPVTKNGLESTLRPVFFSVSFCRGCLPRLHLLLRLRAFTLFFEAAQGSSYQGTAQPQAILGQYLHVHWHSDTCPSKEVWSSGSGHLLAQTWVLQLWLAWRVNLPLNDKIHILQVLLSLLNLSVARPRRNTICSVTSIVENLIGAFLFITCLIFGCGSLPWFTRLVATNSVSRFNTIWRYCGNSPQIRKVKFHLD